MCSPSCRPEHVVGPVLNQKNPKKKPCRLGVQISRKTMGIIF